MTRPLKHALLLSCFISTVALARPPFQNTGTAKHKEKTYSDCVESLVANTLNIAYLEHDKEGNAFFKVSNDLNEETKGTPLPGLITHYTEFLPSDIGSESMRNSIADLLSDHSGIIYISPNTGKKKTYALRPGVSYLTRF